MRLVAAAAVTFAVMLGCTGCGLSGQRKGAGQTITIDLPAARSADDVLGRVTTGHVASGTRRINGHAVLARGQVASATTTVIAPVTSPPVEPLAPAADARLNGVGVWVPYWGLSAAVSDAIDHASVVKVAHPFIDEITGSTVVDQSGGQAPEVSAELAAAHLEVIPTVTETAEMGAFGATLAHPKRRAALLKALEGIADQPGNDGIDLDFENMAIGDGSAAEAERVESLYPQLIAQLCAVLHRTDRSCEVTVMAKNTSGLHDGDGLNTAVYDYSALGEVADRVQIMAYDDHVPSGVAGPIAPWPWVESVIDYAVTQIPADRIVLGVPAYGYDWSSAGGGTSLTATAAGALAAEANAPVQWSETDAESSFHYRTSSTTPGTRIRTVIRTTRTRTGATRKRAVRITVHVKIKHTVDHTVWFEDSTADYDRAVLAADDKLAGIAVWAGGDESPGLWSMLARLR
jgi:spore germination protein